MPPNWANPKLRHAAIKAHNEHLERNEDIFLEVLGREVTESAQADAVLNGNSLDSVNSTNFRIERFGSEGNKDSFYALIGYGTQDFTQKLRDKENHVGTFISDKESGGRHFTARTLTDLMQTVNNSISDDNKLDLNALLGRGK